MKSKRVVVTGLGIVSGLGIGTRLAWSNLLNKACGIRSLEKPEFASLPSRIAAFIDDETLQPHVERTIERSNLRSMSRSMIFSMLATEEALEQAKWNPTDEEARNRTGISVGVSLDNLQEMYDGSVKFREKGYSRGMGPYFIIRMLSNMATAHISIKHKFRGPQLCPSAACATGSHAIGEGYRVIENGDADVMICGGAEAPINPPALAAFCKLRALSTQNESPSTASSPFDAKRKGFVFSEGAGVMVLESLEHAESRGATPIAEVLGFGSTGDAHHITAPNPDGQGAFRCMTAALKDAQLTPDHIGFVNAHATSTPLGDRVESEAIARLTSQRPRPVLVTSNKGATGHMLSASGSVEAIFTVQSCIEGIVPLTLNLSSPDTHDRLDYVMQENREWTREGSRRIAISNSFGFGGVNSSLCIGEFT